MIEKTIALTALLFCVQLYSQTSGNDLKVFLDCNSCDNTYIKQNLDNVEFVRDQNFADVHLFFTTQRNGNGGRMYNVEFIGKNDFTDMKDTISFSTHTDMTRDDVRSLILKQLKLGLVRYWMKKGTAGNITVNIKPKSLEDQKDEKDPWNYWVFQIGANGFFNGQESSKFSRYRFNVSAKRVTEKNKFSFRTSFSENKSTFSFEDDDDIVSVNNSKSMNISDVVSITSHWSAGAFANLGSSTFSNRDFYWSFKPAIEYNFFDYSESAKKQLVVSYRIGTKYNDYVETTIFGKDYEQLWEHSLSLGGSINQKWGNIYAEASFDQYLHDTTLNELSFYIGTSVRLFKGFSFNVTGSYEITRNQINLPAGDVSLEELLLQQQQLKSGYNYYVSLGFSYSFGSIYNSIVNPRFNF